MSSCKQEKEEPVKKLARILKPKDINEYGFKLNDYKVINDTIKKNEIFGRILNRHHIDNTMIIKIRVKVKDTFDVDNLGEGKPYTILASKDSTEKAQVFIYKHDKAVSTIITFKDSVISGYKFRKKIKTVEKQVSGKIYSNFSNAMDSLDLNYNLTDEIADGIYAWTLDFYGLQKGDKFKFIYEEKFIDDSTSVGYGDIKAVVFTHKNKDLYAYRFLADSIDRITEYYDEDGNMLRTQFLKSPIKFKHRISSRYNLKRKIRYYGYRRPHRGTDFAAKIGTEIMATASGTVIKSERKGGNGNYVKVRHNSTYSTQYLHMKKRKVKVGQYVKQGEIIGWIGMTGNTSGPHVCYRFWKNGREVDPFKQKLPPAEPLKKELKSAYLKHIAPLKEQLDSIIFE